MVLWSALISRPHGDSISAAKCVQIRPWMPVEDRHPISYNNLWLVSERRELWKHGHPEIIFGTKPLRISHLMCQLEVQVLWAMRCAFIRTWEPSDWEAIAPQLHPIHNKSQSNLAKWICFPDRYVHSGKTLWGISGGNHKPLWCTLGSVVMFVGPSGPREATFHFQTPALQTLIQPTHVEQQFHTHKMNYASKFFSP